MTSGIKGQEKGRISLVDQIEGRLFERFAQVEYQNETSSLPHAAQLKRGYRGLRFEGDLEDQFVSSWWEFCLVRTRWALVGGAILFALFAIRDLRTLPADVAQITAGIRLILIVPSILLIVALTFVPSVRRWLDWFIGAGVTIAMLGLSTAIVVSAAMGSPVPYEGLMLVMVFVMFLSGLRTYKAAIALVTTVTLFLVGCLAIETPGHVVRLTAYYLLGVTVIGLVGLYSLEYAMRGHFLTEGVARFRALRDPLTLLYNRRAAMDHLERAWRVAFREREPIALLMIDVDFFKRYNDHYGHLNGDGCLTEVALALVDRTRRPMDIVSRYGGEEFMVVLYGSTIDSTRIICEDLRRAVYELSIPHAGHPLEGRITVSVGAGWVEPFSGHVTIDRAFEAADRALYRAKDKGRNRFEVEVLDQPVGNQEGAKVPVSD